METKNRMIRAEDSLWDRVTKTAAAHAWSVSHFVRQALWRATEDKLCFLCGARAVVEQKVRIGGWGDSETIEEMVTRHAAGDTSYLSRSDVAICFAACAAHEAGATDYFLDNHAEISGYSLVAQAGITSRHRTSDTDPAYAAMQEIVSSIK